MRWLWIPALALAVIWPRASAQTWSIDTDRASASFSVRPVWLRRIHGHFPILEGILVRDPARDTVAVDVRIDVRALQMGRAAWVIWAQSPEFFDVERHPWIRFRSDPFPVSQLPEGGLIEGQATLRGVTRRIGFTLAPVECAAFAPDCPIRAEGAVSRSAFAMDARRLSLGDSVTLSFEVMLIQAPDPMR